MAAIDFPASPSVGQAFTAGNGVTYTWNGLLWVASGASAGGDVAAMGTGVGLAANTFATLVNNTIITGNSGGWHNTSNGRYTPPAGRYHLSATLFGYSNAGSLTIQLKFRKNGTDIGNNPVTSAPAANAWGECFADTTVDANGTDYFEVQGFFNPANTGGGSSFTAFPVSGIKGPPGDVGTIGDFLNATRLPGAAVGVATSGSPTTVVFLALPSGDWDVSANIALTPVGGGVGWGLAAGLAASAAIPNPGEGGATVSASSLGSTATVGISLPTIRIVGPATAYLLGIAPGHTSATGYGSINARKMHA